MAKPGKEKIVALLEGVHCASCVVRIEKRLSAEEGVLSVRVHLPTKSAFIEFDPKKTSQEKIRKAIEFSGYLVNDISTPDAPHSSAALSNIAAETTRYAIKTIGAVFITAAILASEKLGLSDYTVFFMATATWGWAGIHFHKGLLASLRTKSPDMNTLVSLSTTTMYIYSTAMLFAPSLFHYNTHHALWHELGMLISFINIGRWMESYSKQNAGNAVANLMNMSPKFARILEKGKEVSVPVSFVKPGHLVSIRPGEQIPVDGEITEGRSAIDESMLTGESIPSDKNPGDKVFAGTINKSGAFIFTATQTGSEMAISRIIRSVRESQAGKAAIGRLVDKVAYYFVPVVLVIAISSAALWLLKGPEGSGILALNAFVSVLAVACPCAMGLAVPMALVVGIDRAASSGILIRNAEVLERIGSIKTVILDKTGTITEGKVFVDKVKTHENETPLIRSALIAEYRSEHPFAQAVRKYASAKGITSPKPDSVQAYPGRGLKATFATETVLAGRPDWLASEGVVVEDIMHPHNSIMAIANNGKLLGFIYLSDRIRQTAKATVQKLQAMNIEVFLVSGDYSSVVAATASQLGIKNFRAGVMPEEKAAIVSEIQSGGKKVAFVGDGFNDAPALSKADIGIALSSGTDIAIESADIVLMRQDLNAVHTAITMSKAIRRVIKQNLFWAFAYNIILIPIAAGAIYPFTGIMLPPYMAGAAMGLSSVSVVLNSLRLRKWDYEKN